MVEAPFSRDLVLGKVVEAYEIVDSVGLSLVLLCGVSGSVVVDSLVRLPGIVSADVSPRVLVLAVVSNEFVESLVRPAAGVLVLMVVSVSLDLP